MLRNIVGRLHVSTSYLGVARAIVNAVKGKHKAWWKVDRKLRKNALREAFDIHKENRELYNAVMTGVF